MLDFLGQGAYATVWKALDRVTEEFVAVKRFEPARQKVHDFYRELRAMFRFRHARIVQIINLLEVSSGARYLILEYCGGGNLRQGLRRMRKNGWRCCPEELGVLTRQLCEGLAVAHEVGLVHRDLKPENVLFERTISTFRESVEVKLADFGLARVLRPPEEDALGGPLQGLSGSPGYMAPEQFLGEYSPKSDLYALGTILYETWHQKPLFEGTPEELVRQHLREPPRFGTNLPTFWQQLLAKLLSKRSEHRPTAVEVLDQLTHMPTDGRSPRVARPPHSQWTNLPKSSVLLFAQPEQPSGGTLWHVISARGVTPLTTDLDHPPLDLPNVREVTSLPDGRLLVVQQQQVLVGPNVHNLVPIFPKERSVDTATLFQAEKGSGRLATMSGEELALWDLGPAEPHEHGSAFGVEEPRRVWHRVVRISGLTPFVCHLNDGRIVCAEGPITPRLVMWGLDGSLDTIIPLPGLCWQLGRWGPNRLYVNVVSADHFQVYDIDLDKGNIIPLSAGRDVASLATCPAPEEALYGIHVDGRVVAWSTRGEHRSVLSFPGGGRRYHQLATDGHQVGALAREQDACCVLFRPLHSGEIESC